MSFKVGDKVRDHRRSILGALRDTGIVIDIDDAEYQDTVVMVRWNRDNGVRAHFEWAIELIIDPNDLLKDIL